MATTYQQVKSTSARHHARREYKTRPGSKYVSYNLVSRCHQAMELSIDWLDREADPTFDLDPLRRSHSSPSLKQPSKRDEASHQPSSPRRIVNTTTMPDQSLESQYGSVKPLTIDTTVGGKDDDEQLRSNLSMLYSEDSARPERDSTYKIPTRQDSTSAGASAEEGTIRPLGDTGRVDSWDNYKSNTTEESIMTAVTYGRSRASPRTDASRANHGLSILRGGTKRRDDSASKQC